MSALSVLQTIAADLASKDNASQVLALADQRVSKNNFGKVRDQAVAYLAAHILSLSNSNFRKTGAGGAITSLREGDLSVGFGATPGADDSLSATWYGQEFERLRRETVPKFT
jgi:hypothetical protein